MSNIEDSDVTRCSPSEPDYNAAADLFLSGHHVEVIAIEALRKAEPAAVRVDGPVVVGVSSARGLRPHSDQISGSSSFMSAWLRRVERPSPFSLRAS